MLSTSGFKGYCFDEITQQPEFTVEWQPIGTGTRYQLFRRGQIGPAMSFTISRTGRKVEHDVAPRSWIKHLYPKYPRLTA